MFQSESCCVCLVLGMFSIQYLMFLFSVQCSVCLMISIQYVQLIVHNIYPLAKRRPMRHARVRTGI